MPQYLFQHLFKVRDYECDIQGVVNNANYLHYMEHTRHLFLEAIGSDFSSLHQSGIDFYVRKVEVEYLYSLKGGNEFVSLLGCEKKGAKGIFIQDLYLPDGHPISRGIVEAVEVCQGKLNRGEHLDRLIKRAKEVLPTITFPLTK